MLLEAIKVCKYFGGLKAVDGVDYHIQEGQIKSIIGPNGAGKSTFFNLIAGLFKPTSGQILFKGNDVTGCRIHQDGVSGGSPRPIRSPISSPTRAYTKTFA